MIVSVIVRVNSLYERLDPSQSGRCTAGTSILCDVSLVSFCPRESNYLTDVWTHKYLFSPSVLRSSRWPSTWHSRSLQDQRLETQVVKFLLTFPSPRARTMTTLSWVPNVPVNGTHLVICWVEGSPKYPHDVIPNCDCAPSPRLESSCWIRVHVKLLSKFLSMSLMKIRPIPHNITYILNLRSVSLLTSRVNTRQTLW